MSKRKADSLADNAPSCSLCSTPFDDDERAARRLACGHYFCSICLAGLTQLSKPKKNTKSSLHAILCPIDRSSTQMRNVALGDVSKLKKLKLTDLKMAGVAASTSGSSSSSSAAAGEALRLYIKNLAGDTYTIDTRSSETVTALKHCIQQANAAFVIARQRLIVPLADDDSEQDDEDVAHEADADAESDNEADDETDDDQVDDASSEQIAHAAEIADSGSAHGDSKVAFGKVQVQDSSHKVLQDARTLASYRLQNETIITLFMTDAEEGNSNQNQGNYQAIRKLAERIATSIRKQNAVLLQKCLLECTAGRIQIAGRVIGDIGVSALCTALLQNGTLATLGIGGNKISSTGAAAFASMMRANSSITHVDLNRNPFGNGGAASLATAFEHNCSVVTLDLTKCKIGPSGCASLAQMLRANTSIRTLRLDHNRIGPSGGSALANALPLNHTLSTISLGNNKMETRGVVALWAGLKKKTALSSIDIGWNLQDESANVSGGLDVLVSNLTLLNVAMKSDNFKAALTCTQDAINDASLMLYLRTKGEQAIANKLGQVINLRNLTSVQIRGGGVHVGTLCASLKLNSSIRKLILADLNLQDADAQEIAAVLHSNKTITMLDLSTNRITAVGIEALSNSLIENCSLLTLDLSGNAIGDKFAELLASALHVNGTLETLNMVGGNAEFITEQGMCALNAALQTNNSVTALHCQNRYDFRPLGLSAGSLQAALKRNRIAKGLEVALPSSAVHSSEADW